MVPSYCLQILTCVLTHFDCGALNFACWGITTNHWVIISDHWGITTRSKVTTLVYDYQPGSYTPVKPFEPPTHCYTKFFYIQNYISFELEVNIYLINQ